MAIIRGRIVVRIVAPYTARPQVKYLYFRQIWRILVESSQILVELSPIEPRYLCYRPFMGHSQIIIDNIWYSTRYSARYWTRGRVTWPRSIKFTIRLRLDLGYRHLVFASTTNLKSGPRFAKIWIYHIYTNDATLITGVSV